MRNFCLSITILAAIVLALGFPATAQDTPAAAPPSPVPQYFTLNLSAGVSLISAPLDTGQTAAENQFIGLPPQYPLFFAWNPHSQQWVQGEQAVAALGGGYWVYLQTPATLVVQGQPYSPSVAVTDHVAPGWHLFGVPFPEGVGWGDFHLYASGNPISLDTAIANGWVDADITTTQGSQVQYQASGQPLLPGIAYWVHTTAPRSAGRGRVSHVSRSRLRYVIHGHAVNSSEPGRRFSAGRYWDSGVCECRIVDFNFIAGDWLARGRVRLSKEHSRRRCGHCRR